MNGFSKLLYVVFTLILVMSCSEGGREVEQNNSSDFKQLDSKITSYSTIKSAIKPVKKQVNYFRSTTNKINYRNVENINTINDYSEFDPFDEFDNQQISTINILKTSDFVEDRIKAIEDLDDYDGSRTVKYIVSALDDPDSKVRIAAINKLTDMDLYAAVEGILYALLDSNPTVVLASLNSIENIFDSSLIPKVQVLLKHSDYRVQRKAKEVIELLE